MFWLITHLLILGTMKGKEILKIFIGMIIGNIYIKKDGQKGQMELLVQ